MRLTEKTNDKLYPYRYSGIDDCMEGTPINRLGQLEDIEEEMNFDLDKLFKALKDGIYVKDYEGEVFDLTEDKIYITFDSISGYYLDHYTFGAYYFKDYGKTWALTKEELE